MVNMPRVSSSCDPAPSASRSLDDPEDDPEEDNPLENIESEAALRRTTSQATYSTFEVPREGTSRQSPTRVEYTPPMLARVSAELTAQQLTAQQQQQQDETADQDETKNNIMSNK